MNHQVPDHSHIEVAVGGVTDSLGLQEDRSTHNTSQLANGGVESLKVTNLENTVILLRQVDQTLGLNEVDGDRLFDQNVNSILNEIYGEGIVQTRGDGDIDSLYPFFDERAVIGEKRGVKVCRAELSSRLIDIN